MRFFNWCRSIDAILGYRRILFGSEVQESFMITPKLFWILKKNTPLFFLINYRRCLSNDPGKVDSNFFCYAATVLSPHRSVLIFTYRTHKPT